MKTTSTLNKLCKCPGVDQGTLLTHWCFKMSPATQLPPRPASVRGTLTHAWTHTHIHTHLKHTSSQLEQNSSSTGHVSVWCGCSGISSLVSSFNIKVLDYTVTLDFLIMVSGIRTSVNQNNLPPRLFNVTVNDRLKHKSHLLSLITSCHIPSKFHRCTQTWTSSLNPAQRSCSITSLHACSRSVISLHILQHIQIWIKLRDDWDTVICVAEDVQVLPGLLTPIQHLGNDRHMILIS